LYILHAVEVTATWTNDRIRAIRDLIVHTSDYVKAAAPGLYSHELIQVMFAQPYVRIGHLIDSRIAERHAASRYLKQLAAIGVLFEEKRGRDKLFVHRKYMDLLGRDDHAFPFYPAVASWSPSKRSS
jgi:hypothetical protein